MKNKHVRFQTANGTAIKIERCVNLNFEIGGTMNHLSHAVSDLNINVILGRDWLKQNGVRCYYDLGSLRVNGTL